MRFEEEFGLEIPDRDAELLATPRNVADYLCSRIDLVPAVQCLTATEFYRLRSALLGLGVARLRIRPRMSFADVFPDSERARSWMQLGTSIAALRWPSLQHPWLRPKQLAYPRGCETVWDLARHLATWSSAVPSGSGAAWTAELVLLRVRQITVEQLCIKSFSDDDHYVRDLRLDA